MKYNLTLENAPSVAHVIRASERARAYGAELHGADKEFTLVFLYPIQRHQRHQRHHARLVLLLVMQELAGFRYEEVH